MNNLKKQPSISVQGYRGTRDIYPEDQRLRSYIYNSIHSVMQSFGYEEFTGPFVEHFELYAAKSSEEIVNNQLYNFKDRGDRHLAIRPEMTPTLARMVASRHKELVKPLRWYTIPTCMRYERPQRGRLREFDQLNVDVFGGEKLDEDIEIILTAIELLKKLGGDNSKFKVYINHRGLFNDLIINKFSLSSEQSSPLFKLIDKLDKLPKEKFDEELSKVNLTSEQTENIRIYLSITSFDDLFDFSKDFSQYAEEFKSFLNIIQKIVPGYVEYSPKIMRGFDYYTGMVFEIFDLHPENNRALYGGGRYDNLVGAFGVEPIPGVGYGVSDVCLINFLQSHSLVPDLKKNLDVSVLRLSESDRLESILLSNKLRGLGLNVESPLSQPKLSKQIQNAEKRGAKSVIFQGEDERKNNCISLKILSTGEQTSISLNELEKVKEALA